MDPRRPVCCELVSYGSPALLLSPSHRCRVLAGLLAAHRAPWSFPEQNPTVSPVGRLPRARDRLWIKSPARLTWSGRRGRFTLCGASSLAELVFQKHEITSVCLTCRALSGLRSGGSRRLSDSAALWNRGGFFTTSSWPPTPLPHSGLMGVV